MCDFPDQNFLGEFQILNQSQPAPIKHSPLRTKRVFVLADSGRPQTTNFLPTRITSPNGASNAVNSPKWTPQRRNEASASRLALVGSHAKDDATFLSLLHLEPLLDRDLFRSTA